MGENQTFYIPEGFQGFILVIHRSESEVQKKASPYSFIGREYNIPSSGILVTDYDFKNEGLIRENAFYISSNKKIKIENNTIRDPVEPYEGVRFFWIFGRRVGTSEDSNNKQGFRIYLVSDFKNLNIYRKNGFVKTIDFLDFNEEKQNIFNWNLTELKRIKDSCDINHKLIPK